MIRLCQSNCVPVVDEIQGEQVSIVLASVKSLLFFYDITGRCTDANHTVPFLPP